MRNGCEPRTIGFHEQTIFRYACGNVANVLRISERDDARDGHIPAEIERPAREFPRFGEAMQYADSSFVQAQEFERVGFSCAGVDDDRQRDISRDVEVRGEAVALRPFHNVSIYLEVVEPGLSDSNDSLMARRFTYPVERLFLASAFRMQPRAGPYVRMAFGKVDYRALGIGIHSNAEKRANTHATRSREASVSVVEIVQMAVRIDQHTYMVCVWRSDCSAPAR